MYKLITLFVMTVFLMPLAAISADAFQLAYTQAPATPKSEVSFNGRWRVKFVMSGLEKNLILDAKGQGVAFLSLMDTGPDNKPVPNPLPAAWSQLTNERVSFSGEAELPIGTCCREWGSLIFKGKFSSSNSISGTLIFVTGIDEEESPDKFHSLVGTFQANRISN